MRSLSLLALSALLLSSVMLMHVNAQSADEDAEDVQVFDDSVEGGRSDSATSIPDDTDEYDEEEEYDGAQYTPSPDVKTAVYFPEYPDKNFPLDEEISALIVFSNNGAKTFNISHCVSSLHSPFDLSYYVQNFSSHMLAVVVEPHRQITVEFKFKPDKNLEANEFWLSGYIVYNDTNSERVYVGSFVNTTVALVDLSAAPVFQAISNFLVLGGIVGGIGYLVYVSRFKKTGKSGKSQASRTPRAVAAESPEAGASSPTPSGFESAVYKQAEKSKAVKRKKEKDGKKEKKATGVSAASTSAASKASGVSSPGSASE